jgi:hypothetical protein
MSAMNEYMYNNSEHSIFHKNEILLKQLGEKKCLADKDAIVEREIQLLPAIPLLKMVTNECFALILFLSDVF